MACKNNEDILFVSNVSKFHKNEWIFKYFDYLKYHKYEM